MRDDSLLYGWPQESMLEGHQKWHYGENPGSAAIFIKTVFAGLGYFTIIRKTLLITMVHY